MINPLLKRAFQRDRFERLMVERFTEPLHVNAMALGAALFGSFRRKVDFDLVVRPQYAFPILRAADFALEWGYKTLTLVEFGVAAGAGLLNICNIARRVTKETGIEFRVVGFDTGQGMPPPIDYRDMPEYYHTGDFPMDHERLRANLPSNCELILGNIEETIGPFFQTVGAAAPIGFASIDVDYYSSAKQSLALFQSDADKYLPIVPIYLDDVGDVAVNPWVGEALAVNEFNDENPLRKIAPYNMLRARRYCKNAKWIEHIFTVHTHDHPIRTPGGRQVTRRVIGNEFIGVSFDSKTDAKV